MDDGSISGLASQSAMGASASRSRSQSASKPRSKSQQSSAGYQGVSGTMQSTSENLGVGEGSEANSGQTCMAALKPVTPKSYEEIKQIIEPLGKI